MSVNETSYNRYSSKQIYDLLSNTSLGQSLSNNIGSVGQSQSSLGGSQQPSGLVAELLGDDLGGGVEALNGDVISEEAELLVGVDSLSTSLDISGLLDEVSLLLEGELVSGGVDSLSVLLVGLDGSAHGVVSKTGERVDVLVDEVVRVSRELDTVSLDKETVVVLGKFPE